MELRNLDKDGLVLTPDTFRARLKDLPAYIKKQDIYIYKDNNREKHTINYLCLEQQISRLLSCKTNYERIHFQPLEPATDGFVEEFCASQAMHSIFNKKYRYCRKASVIGW